MNYLSIFESILVDFCLVLKRVMIITNKTSLVGSGFNSLERVKMFK